MALKMKYSILYFFYFLLCIFVLNTLYAYQKKSSNKINHIESSQYGYEIARNDTVNLRVFVVVDRKLLNNYSSLVVLTKTLRDSLEKFRVPKYGHQQIKIDISFFSSKEYATYKDNISLEKIKKWQESYIAEYSGENKTVQLYPMDPKKTKFLPVK
ncbi:MAG: hypothetical protein ABR936_10465 [Bacteroidota bacterium]|jgi:hypothetical protein